MMLVLPTCSLSIDKQYRKIERNHISIDRMQKREIKTRKPTTDDVTKMLARNDAAAAAVDVVVLIPDIAFSFAFSLFSYSWIFFS
jgi:hypothetical protein